MSLRKAMTWTEFFHQVLMESMLYCWSVWLVVCSTSSKIPGISYSVGSSVAFWTGIAGQVDSILHRMHVRGPCKQLNSSVIGDAVNDPIIGGLCCCKPMWGE